MTCFTPVDAWMSERVNDKGNSYVTFSKSEADMTAPIEITCGKCDGCLLDKRKRLGVQVYHEAQMTDFKCMATLTYDEDHNPGVIRKEDGQKFIKRMRNWPNSLNFKYLIAGEYGERTHRPHFHMAIIGHDFLGGPDCQTLGEDQYSNKLLTDIWGMGAVHIVPLTIERCMYVTGYCMKKMGEDDSWSSHSTHLGKTWLAKYWRDIANTGQVIINGQSYPIPKAYFAWANGKLDDLLEDRRFYQLTRFKNDGERWANRKNLETQQINLKARIAQKAGKKL